MKYVVSPERAKLVVEGQPAEHMYIVFSGKVHRETAELGIVGYGDIGYLFGDGALSDLHAIYKETVIAQSEVHCLTLQKSDIDRLSQDAEINEKIEDLRAIKKCSLFTMWSRAQAERLLQTGYRKTYSPGQYINRQNETPDFLYLILEGLLYFSF
jgi:CRP-like cAMP-binding protein